MLRALLAAVIVCSAMTAQTQSMEIVLERSQNGAWNRIDPGLVLGQGDLVRFRFRATFSGYLYVINSGTSGTQSVLFPSEATGRNNRIEAERDYFVPATGAAFKVAGPAGHDVVYWLMSPAPLEESQAAGPAREDRTRPAQKLIPRCDQTIFRARGLCVDSSAGPRNVADPATLPAVISATPNLAKRELVIVRDKDKSRVSSAGELTGPVVYEVRLAHL